MEINRLTVFLVLFSIRFVGVLERTLFPVCLVNREVSKFVF